ncbi:MAG: RsiV family protein [Eubacteriales bacterium]|nr:RsiV family protein [Eubacteriales bacterium]
MKRIISIMMAAVLLLSLTACKAEKEPEPVTEKAIDVGKAPETEESLETVVIVDDSAFQNAPEESGVLPEPVKAFITNYYECGQRTDNTLVYESSIPWVNFGEAGIASGLNDMTHADFERLIKRTAEWRDEEVKYADEIDLEGAYSDSMTNAKILRSDSSVLSFRTLNVGYNKGGAHGYEIYLSFNYDLEGKKLLSLKDVFIDTDKLMEMITERLVSEYPETVWFDEENILKYFDPATSQFETDKSHVDFALSNSGVNFYFNAGDIAPYADGAKVIEFSYDELKGIISPKYATAPLDYIEYLEPGANHYFGHNNLIKAFARYNEYGMADGIVVFMGGHDTVIETFANNIELYLVSIDERYYIYAIENGEDDEVSLHVIDLNTPIPSSVDKIDARLYTARDIGNVENPPAELNCYGARNTVSPLTNPHSFELEPGKYGGDSVTYRTGENGMPEKCTN